MSFEMSFDMSSSSNVHTPRDPQPYPRPQRPDDPMIEIHAHACHQPLSHGIPVNPLRHVACPHVLMSMSCSRGKPTLSSRALGDGRTHSLARAHAVSEVDDVLLVRVTDRFLASVDDDINRSPHCRESLIFARVRLAAQCLELSEERAARVHAYALAAR